MRRSCAIRADYFGEIKKVSVDDDQLSLAKELIKRKAAKFAPEKFKDEYEAALRELVEAKVKHAPIPHEEPVRKSAKVINLMDALRKSVRGDEAPAGEEKGSRKIHGDRIEEGPYAGEVFRSKDWKVAEVGIERYGHKEEVQTEGGIRSRCGRRTTGTLPLDAGLRDYERAEWRCEVKVIQ